MITGYSAGSTGTCAPWIPPVFVSPETGDALERAVQSPEVSSSSSGYAAGVFGGRGAGPRGVPRPSQTKSPVHPQIVRSKAGTSWSLGAAKYVSSSDNAKIGAVDATWVSIEATCVDCSFKESRVCYAMGGQAADTTKKLDTIAVANKISSEQASLEEAACIDSAYEGMDIPHGRFLRLHASGDTSTRPGAQAIRSAIGRWFNRGGAIAYTYTHAWRRVPRADFGPQLSVLASLNPDDDARGALAAGYGSVTALFPVEVWSQRMVITRDGALLFGALPPSDGLPEDWKWFACPAQYPVDKIDMVATYGGSRIVSGSSKTVEASPIIKWRTREGVRAKSLYLAKRIGARYDEVLAVMEKVEYSPDNGHPFAARSKHLMALAPHIERAGLPRPGTEAFGQMFRAIGANEKATCDKCKRCYSDLPGTGGAGARAVVGKSLRELKRGIAFRPDLSGGVIKTESLLQKVISQRVAAAAE